jgi:hypothetical protein
MYDVSCCDVMESRKVEIVYSSQISPKKLFLFKRRDAFSWLRDFDKSLDNLVILAACMLIALLHFFERAWLITLLSSNRHCQVPSLKISSNNYLSPLCYAVFCCLIYPEERRCSKARI